MGEETALERGYKVSQTKCRGEGEPGRAAGALRRSHF